jgi:hypothetical protein
MRIICHLARHIDAVAMFADEFLRMAAYLVEWNVGRQAHRQHDGSHENVQRRDKSSAGHLE